MQMIMTNVQDDNFFFKEKQLFGENLQKIELKLKRKQQKK